jgi:PTS system nitrogen regulatory IIA component
MHMKHLLSVDRVISRLTATHKRHALHRLATEISERAALPAAKVVTATMEMADVPSYGPGNGVALPHALLSEIQKPMALFARLEPPVEFGAADGRPVDLVMLLLSPKNDTHSHLRALACIARRLSDDLVRRKLRAAESADEMYVALLGNELVSDQPAKLA